MKINEILIETLLDELVGVKQQTKQFGDPAPVSDADDEDYYDTSKDYGHVLRKQGFKFIGSGAYGSVWEHPKLNYVLKIFSGNDNAYLAWANTCIQHKDNPNLPKFVSTKPVKIPGTDLYALRMEKLAKAPESPIYQEMERLMSACMFGMYAEDNLNNFPNLIDTSKTDDNSDYRYPVLRNYVKTIDPGITEAIWLAIQTALTHRLGIDVSANNCMVRGNTLVFTDPVV